MPTVARRSWALPLLLIAALLLQGCGLLSASETPLPATTDVLAKLPTVSNSPRSPCWQQREIAEQRSYLETVRTGRKVTYFPPDPKCDSDFKPGAEPTASAPRESSTAQGKT